MPLGHIVGLRVVGQVMSRVTFVPNSRPEESPGEFKKIENRRQWSLLTLQ
jgi:hypothetical protein